MTARIWIAALALVAPLAACDRWVDLRVDDRDAGGPLDATGALLDTGGPLDATSGPPNDGIPTVDATSVPPDDDASMPLDGGLQVFTSPFDPTGSSESTISSARSRHRAGALASGSPVGEGARRAGSPSGVGARGR